MRGGAVAARRAHNPKVTGSSPVPATKGDQRPPRHMPWRSLIRGDKVCFLFDQCFSTKQGILHADFMFSVHGHIFHLSQ